MGDRLWLNVFCNDGESVIQTDNGPVTVTGKQFLRGWQGRPPPFGQSELHVREALDAGTYEVAAWRNDDVRARWTDSSGKRWSVVTERNGRTFQRDTDPTPPADAQRDEVTYLNISVKPPTQREKESVEKKGRFD